SSQELQVLCNLFRVYPNDLLGFVPTGEEDERTDPALDFRMNTGMFALSENDRREVKEMVCELPPHPSLYYGKWQEAFSTYRANRNRPFWSTAHLAQAVRSGLRQVEPP